MARLLPLLPAALFLSGIAAGRFWKEHAAADPRPFGAVPAPVRTSSFQPVEEGEENDFARKTADASLAEIVALWDALADDDFDKPPQVPGVASPGPWKRMLLLERWAELDAPGALEAARGHGADLPALLAAVFRSWAARDPAAALVALKAGPAETRTAAATGWLSAWRDDPALLVRRAADLRWMDVSALKEEEFRQAVPAEVLRKAHAANREGLLLLSGWLPPWYDGVLRRLDWRAAWTKGGEEARAAVDSLPAGNEDILRMGGDLSPLFRTRPEEAMDLLERLMAKGSGADWAQKKDDIWSGGFLMREMVETVGVTDPARVLRLLSLKPGDWRAESVLHAVLIEGLAGTNPAAALRLAAGLSGMDHVAVISGPPPPRLEPAAALEAARNAPPSWLRDVWLERALLEMPPDAAAAWADALPAGELRDSANLTLDSRFLPEGERALRRVVSQFPGDSVDSSARERVWNAALRASAAAEVPALTERVASWPEGAARNEAVVMMTLRWAAQDTRGALEWRASLTDGDESLRTASSKGIVRGWAGEDPAGASTWVDSLPAGPSREAAADELAARLAPRDPESAARWAASLRDPRARQDRLDAVISTWASADAAAAGAGIRALPGLTDAERASLLRSLPSTP